jgi:hypothetical protein
MAGYLLCTNRSCRGSLLLGLEYPDVYLEPWEGPQNAARRSGDVSQAATLKDWPSINDTVVVGAMKVPVVVPSRHAPRSRRVWR